MNIFKLFNVTKYMVMIIDTIELANTALLVYLRTLNDSTQ